MGVTTAIAAAASAATSVGTGIAGAVGGGSGSTYSAGGSNVPGAATYIPYNQAGNDTNLNNLLQQMYGPATSLPGQLDSLYTSTANAVDNNPYFWPAVGNAGNLTNAGQNLAQYYGNIGQSLLDAGSTTSGTQSGYGSALGGLTSQLAPQEASGAGAVQNYADTIAPWYTGLASYLPTGGSKAYQSGQGLSSQALGQTGNLAGFGLPGAQQTAGLASSGVPYAQQILQTGFDPQNQLYNRQYQQMLDQQNAINSMNGVAGTPYGAGLDTQAAQDFNLNWQNQQLGRQSQALGAYNQSLGQNAGAASTVGNLGSQALSNYLGGYNASGSLGTQGLQNLISANTASGALDTAGLNALLSGNTGAAGLNATALQSALAGYGGASQIAGQGYNTLGQAGSAYADLNNLGLQGLLSTYNLPYNQYQAGQQNLLGALNAEGSGIQNSYGLMQQLLGNYQSYLGLGQAASGQAQYGQNQAFGQQQQSLNNIGQGLSLGANSLNSLFGSSLPSSPYSYSMGSYTPMQSQSINTIDPSLFQSYGSM